MPSMTLPLLWPTTDELASLARSLAPEGTVGDRLELLRMQLGRLVDLGAAPATEAALEAGAFPATWELVGALSGLTTRLRTDIEAMLDEIRTIEQMRDAIAFDLVLDA